MEWWFVEAALFLGAFCLGYGLAEYRCVKDFRSLEERFLKFVERERSEHEDND